MALNVVTARFTGKQTASTSSLFQWDYGQLLDIVGLNLPETFQVHFSDQPILGTAKTQVGTNNQVSIPDEYLQSGRTVYAWIFLHEGDSDGETEYVIKIPVKQRSKPIDEVPTPTQRSAIDEAIDALNVAVESTAADAASARQDADRAEQAVQSAGYMFFHIDKNGDLIYQSTPNVDVDFYLNDGDLYVRAAE